MPNSDGSGARATNAAIGKPPEFSGGRDNLKSFKERLECWMTLNNTADKQKKLVLISCLSGEAYDVLRNLTSPDVPSTKTYDQLLQLMEDHYDPAPLTIGERYTFWRRDQIEGENVNQYVVALRKLAGSCDFGQFLDDALRDRFVCGLKHEYIQKHLLSQKDLTLKKAVDLAQGLEQASDQASTFHKGESAEVHKIHHQGRKHQPGGKSGVDQHRKKGNNSSNGTDSVSDAE